MRAPKRVVIPIDSEEPASWELARAYAEKMLELSEVRSSEVILLTHTKQQLRHTSLGSHIGEGAVKALLKNQTLSMPSSARLRHETIKTIGTFVRGAVVIVFYADEELLELVDGLDGIAGVVVVPWIPGDVDNWIARWNPIVHGKPQTEAADLLSDKTVERALTSVTRMINLAHGVLHPRDKQYADDVLRILRAKGHMLKAETIKSWAISKGWKPDAASELAKLANRIANLKSKPSISKIHDPHGRYERWVSGQD